MKEKAKKKVKKTKKSKKSKKSHHRKPAKPEVAKPKPKPDPGLLLKKRINKVDHTYKGFYKKHTKKAKSLEKNVDRIHKDLRRTRKQRALQQFQMRQQERMQQMMH